MLERNEMIGNKSVGVVEYNTLGDFYQYICDTPFNEAFRWARHSSVEGRESFTKTYNFQQAVELFQKGWSDMAEKLTQKLKVIQNEVVPNTKAKTIYDAAGFQCSVPRYLQGIPTSMINRKNVPVKQKVVNITKSINYHGGVGTDTIMEESIKALQIVKKLEAQGLRVNLNIALGTFERSKSFIIKIRIKSANERLNVSKVAFPLVHPSMLRRLFFRFIEVYPQVTSEFTNGYGTPCQTEQLKKAMPNDYVLPAFIRKDMSKINTIDDLENLESRF